MTDAAQFKYVGTRPVRPDGVDKVTGRAAFGADFTLPGMLHGLILRSPHAHARIKSVDLSAALEIDGVFAAISSADFPEVTDSGDMGGEGGGSIKDLSDNCMARGKALYHGHAVAAVAATSLAKARQALAAIKVDYEALAPVMDLDAALADDAPLLNEEMMTQGLAEPATKPSNIASRMVMGRGDVAKGFEEADVVLEETYRTPTVHQGYIEPHACVARYGEDGQAEIWGSSQGHFQIRAFTARLLGLALSDLRVTPAEIGGGFGGKTVVYLEPIALALARKSGRPVKLAMTREEVFKATGPTSGAAMTIRLGATRDGRITAAEGRFRFQAGAFPGSPVLNACMCAFAPYALDNVLTVGYDVVCNRPKSAAYRAPGSPISAFAVESALDVLARKLGIDPLELRRRNAAREGTQAAYGPKFGSIAYLETIDALRNHPHYQTPLGPNQGRGVASGYWFNNGGESSATIHLGEDGTAVVATGSPDIGGSRASMAIMAAETLGIDYDRVRPIVADTASIGFTGVTGGSRVTLATGLAVIEAAKKLIKDLRRRAALIWDVEVEGVVWEDGQARPASSNVGDFEPLSLKEIAAKKSLTGGPIGASASVNAGGVGPGFSTQVCDVEVDPETGKVTILRWTAAQDVGRAIHPGYVEGQIQGGAVQGIGWALNEEYIYDDQGRLENPGFLDYRMPVASDLPMIDALLVEVPNPGHPYGVKGVGEVNICPPMAAIANAIEDAVGVRMTGLPMSPPRLLETIDASRPSGAP